MLNEILTISGKQGLFKLLTRGRGALIVENIDETKKRFPIQGTDKVVSLGDISIFTDEREMPLREVFQAIEDKLGKKVIEFDWRKASNPELLKFFGDIVPDFDRERVYPSHIKKIAGWYDLLVKYGENDFSELKAEEADAEGKADAKAE
ncbi:MAG: DUF5606 domain-containing protein [Bacteroidaceae bacterium]|nr:DUF5606 domain-containing protein [Bacteroidaceae bacterium]